MSILTPKNMCLLRVLRSHAFYRYTSTTGSSKGHAISMPTSATQLNANHPKPKLDLSFEDSKTAFRAKTNLDLLRGYIVFQLCSVRFLVDNQKTILDLTRRVFGKHLFAMIMRSTFYGHFVAGKDQQDIRPNVENMMKFGVKSILDYSAEEDLNAAKDKTAEESGAVVVKGKYFDPSEAQSDKNKKIFLDCIDAVSDVTNSTGIAAVKITSLIRPTLLLKLSSFVKLVKESRDAAGQDLFAWKSMLAKSDAEFAQLFNGVKGLSKPHESFSESELGELRNMLIRMDEIIEHAAKNNVRLFVDAEQTYFQDAIHRFTVEIMRHFNRDKCVVLNTYQNYLKSAFTVLKEDIEQAAKENFYFGAKLVRGAYIDQERERATEMGYEDPINEDYDATTRMYEKSLMYCLDQVKVQPKGRVSVMVASHNEDTVKFAVEKMQEYGIKPQDRIVCFGQLLGMCDYISFYLGGIGYSVYKYVPYGPIEEVLPYLSRRASENRGIFEKVKKEKRLLLTELKRRFKGLEFY